MSYDNSFCNRAFPRLANCFSFGNEHARPAKHELRLLAGITVLELLGDAQGIHSFHGPAADPFMQSRVVGGSRDSVIGMNTMPVQGELNLPRFDLDTSRPALDSLSVLQRRARSDNALQVEADVEELV